MNPRAFLTVAVFYAASPATAQQSCDNLASASIRGIAIESAVSVSAGPFTVPGSSNASRTHVPAFCRVTATVDKELRFELWMPRQWNQKFLAVGNGGLAGSISYGAMIKPLQRGYATAGTDTGHQSGSSTNGEWAFGHYERIVNFADRATHLMAQASKLILNRFYAAAPAHAYFNGCSQGGHEAMIEAQRYPADFDGIIAGDPANNWTRHYIGGHLCTALATDGDGYMTPDKV